MAFAGVKDATERGDLFRPFGDLVIHRGYSEAGGMDCNDMADIAAAQKPDLQHVYHIMGAIG